jgi:Tfp pilus assembly PilM family ATPase
MRLLTVKETVVGLDLGRHTVRAVWLEKGPHGPCAARREALRLPFDGKGGREALELWIGQQGLKEAGCAVALPGTQALFQPLLLPKDDPRTDAQAAAVEVLKYNEMVSDSMRHAFAPFSLRPDERRLLLAMARTEAVAETVQQSQEMGLRVIEVVPSAVALYNAAAPRLDETPTLLIGVGAGGTDVAVGSASGLFFVRSFAVGGRLFTEMLARHWKIGLAQAESRKETEGGLTNDRPGHEALLKAAETWLNELRACLSIYGNLFPDPVARPARLVLAGGGVRLAGFREYVAGALNVPLVEDVAADEVGETGGMLGEWATAWGLALTGAGAGRCAISLLPEWLRHEREFRRQKPVWIAAAAVAGLVFLVGLAGGYRDFRRKSGLLNAQKASLMNRKRLASAIERARAQNERLQAMAAVVRGLMGGAPVIRDLLDTLQTAKDPADWITMVADADSYFEKGTGSSLTAPARVGGSGERMEPPPPPFQRVLIEGYTRRGNLATVKRLIEGLAAAPFVASADLLSDDEVVADEASEREGTVGARRFVIDLRLRER